MSHVNRGGRSSGSRAWQRNPQFSYSSSSHTPRNVAGNISVDGLRLNSASSRKVSQPANQPSPSQSSKTPSTPTTTDLYSAWSPCQTTEPPKQEEAAGEKRKRYQSTDDPMGMWIPFIPSFLNALLERDGLGRRWRNPICELCRKCSPGDNIRIFRCSDCFDIPVCLECLLSCHQHHPLHIVEEWTDGFWKRTSLQALGLVYYFDHSTTPCPGHDRIREMVVIHTNGIHRVNIQYCACRSTDASSNIEQILRAGWYPATVTDPHTCATFRVLDLFRMLNVVGNTNCDAFLKTLERMTDPCQLTSLPERYNAFTRMERQYSFLLRIKRSGRPYRVALPGDVAVLCWACPQEGMNLLPGWRDDDPSKQFLYMLIVALDANFRLKNRIRAKEKNSQSLGSGFAYFVESSAYKEHLKNYVAEEDVSTCVAFAALLEKETKFTTGLRTSGVAGVVCARHELVRPLGIGDLQKGERYSNMDYVLFSALLGLCLKRITVSYDISCQHKKNL